MSVVVGGCQFDTCEMCQTRKLYRAGKTFCIEMEKCIEVANRVSNWQSMYRSGKVSQKNRRKLTISFI